MNSTILSIPIDPTIKKQAEAQAEKSGIRLDVFMESILDKALKTFVKNAFGTDIVIRIQEEPSKLLLASMKKAKENRKNGNTSPAFHTAKEMNDWLDRQGV